MAEAGVPPAFQGVLVCRAMELAYQARLLIPQFPWQGEDAASSNLNAFAVGLRDVYRPALPTQIGRIDTYIGTYEFFAGGGGVIGMYSPLSRFMGVPRQVHAEDHYSISVATAIHESVHADQFFPPEIRDFVPTIDGVHDRIRSIFEEARASGVFKPFKDRDDETARIREAAYRRFVEHVQTVWPSLAAELAERSGFPPGNLEHAIINIAATLPDYDILKISSSAFDLAEYAIHNRLLNPPIPDVPVADRVSIQEQLTDLVAEYFPELHAALQLQPLDLDALKNEESAAYLMLARAMLALLDTPGNRAHATAIYLRTLCTWRNFREVIERDVSRLPVEAEAYIVEALAKAPAGTRLARVRVPVGPWWDVALPPQLQDVDFIMEMFSGASPASRGFLERYREDAVLTAVLAAAGH
jgi:hypothetical protein